MNAVSQYYTSTLNQAKEENATKGENKCKNLPLEFLQAKPNLYELKVLPSLVLHVFSAKIKHAGLFYGGAIYWYSVIKGYL